MFDIRECTICYNYRVEGREFHICYKERRIEGDGHKEVSHLLQGESGTESVCCNVDSHLLKGEENGRHLL